MKYYGLLIVIFGILIPACDQDYDREISLSDGFYIYVNDKPLITPYDIDYYDHSTHMIYLKQDHPLNTNPENYSSVSGVQFTVKALNEDIYTGIIRPSYSCSLSAGPTIEIMPSFHSSDIIAIGMIFFCDSLGKHCTEDPRNDPRIIEALKKYDQYHEGLHCCINTIKVKSRSGDRAQLEFTFTIYNVDDFNYYILDPDKMGIGVFHYFTNGLFISDKENRITYSYQGEHVQPDPWNSWQTKWLTRLKSGDKITFRLLLDEYDYIPPGTYQASFAYPGLSHVDKEERIRNNGRIWLGGIRASKEIIIE